MNQTVSILGSIDEAARRRFESAWASGNPTPIDDFLPPADDPRRNATLQELILIELDFAWKAYSKAKPSDGSRPSRVEDYLSRFPELNSSTIIGQLLEEEFLVRKRHGDAPSTAEYRDRFPALSTIVAGLETGSWVPRPNEDRPPAVDGYQVMGVLGRGGMGIVYEAREERLGRVVALKTSRVGREAGRKELQARFLAEARVEHPGVVPVHELVTPANGEPFYTMKLVRGRTLADAIGEFFAAEQPPSERAVARRRLLEAFLAVVRTMAFAHEKGVIHRDLKPANVVLGEFGETVILDWGLAKVLNEPDDVPTSMAGIGSPDLTARGEVLGTPAYMAPEQAAGRTEEIDEQSDVYALGAILYHILTGSHPHRGHTASLLQVIQEQEPARPSTFGSVPRPLEAICLKAMAKRRKQRYPDAKALADDVERCLAGEPISVYRERLHERFSRWARRHRTLVAVGVVAFLLTTSSVAIGYYLRSQAEHDRREQALEFERDRDRLAFEAERQQTQARTEKREVVLRTVQSELSRGRAEWKAGRFSAAERAFQKGLAELPPGDELEMRAQLERLHREAEKVAAFARYWERAEVEALKTDDVSYGKGDAAVAAACEIGLRHLGVLDGPVDRWNQLPDGELLEPQRRRLRTDAASALGLLAMWRTKRGFELEVKNKTAESNAAYRDALEPLGRIQAYVRAEAKRNTPAAERGSPAAGALELFCRLRLGERPKLTTQPLPAENAADLYFLGVAHLFLADTMTGTPFDRVVLARFGDFTKQSGLDFKTPLLTAERQLRAAVAMDQGHYLAHYWLARCLMRTGNYAAAEQAFTACVALRPEYASGYVSRAATLLIESYTVKEPKPPRLPADLRDAALRGLEKAPESVRGDPQIRWIESKCLQWLGREDDANSAAADAIVMEIVQRHGIATGLPSIAPELLKFTEDRSKLIPDQKDLHAILSAANFANKKLTAAEREAEWVLSRDPKNGLAIAVRGMMRLEAGDAGEALRQFDSALAASPQQGLAKIGRAWALEQLGDWNGALAVHTSLLPTGLAGAGPQHLQPYLGQARVFNKLSRAAEARKAIDAAREIDPVAAEDVAAKLFLPNSK